MDQIPNGQINFQNKTPGNDVSLKPESSLDRKRTKGKRVITAVFIVTLACAIVTGIILRFLFHMYQTLPSPEELCNIQPSLVTRVLACDSTLVHEFSIERRFWAPLSDIPLDLQHAVVSIEDRTFYSHWGINLKRIMSAAFTDIILRDYAQGASTLTQQLARNVYLTSRQTIVRKIREIMTAVQLESYYTKNEIMELYLNMVYLGAGVYGVEAASQRYFSKSVKDLNLNECSVLAGCIQLPEHYRPDKKKNKKRTTMRRNTVLRAMKKMKYIKKEVAIATSGDSIPSNPQPRRSKRAPYFIEMVRQHMEKKYGEHLLYNGGLTIYTTLNPVAQDSTDYAVSYFLDSLQRRTNRLFLDSTQTHVEKGINKVFFLDHFDSLYTEYKEEYKELPDSLRHRIVQASVVALDVKTGAIRVLTGGRDFSESKFNRALQARRQPGSAIKPLVYTVAVDSGYTPATTVMDQPITLQTPEGLWRPENYEKEFYGQVTIREALRRSINLVAIQVCQDIGVRNIINYARKAGLKHRLPPVPAFAIGACEATCMEMTSAYSIYPNHGLQAKPYCIEKVFDKNGRLLEQNTPEIKKVISSQTAYIMTSLLSTVINSGTGASARRRGFMHPAGGKTGTTNGYSDAWFVGFTPQIACGVWVGVDVRRSMGHGVTGSSGAIPMWAATMRALHKNLPKKGFGRPKGIVSARVCKKEHKIATRYCPDVYEDIFNVAAMLDTCDIHVPGGIRNKQNVRTRFGSGKKIKKDSGKKKKRSLIF